MKQLRSLALGSLIFMTAGCVSHHERRHIYTLEEAPDAPAQAGDAAERPTLQLQRVLIPDYLDTTGIVSRVGPHQIHESATGRFGERLSLGVTRALRADLAAHLPQDSIALAQSAEQPARQMLVTVDTFEVALSGHCVLVADWSILDAKRRTAISGGSGTFTADAAGTQPEDGAIVAAMADAVGQLARRIASAIEALPPS